MQVKDVLCWAAFERQGSDLPRWTDPESAEHVVSESVFSCLLPSWELISVGVEGRTTRPTWAHC